MYKQSLNAKFIGDATYYMGMLGLTRIEFDSGSISYSPENNNFELRYKDISYTGDKKELTRFVKECKYYGEKI